MAAVDAFLQERRISSAVKRRVRWYYEWVWLARSPARAASPAPPGAAAASRSAVRKMM